MPIEKLKKTTKRMQFNFTKRENIKFFNNQKQLKNESKILFIFPGIIIVYANLRATTIRNQWKNY